MFEYNITPRPVKDSDCPTPRLFTLEARGHGTADQMLTFALKLIATVTPDVEFHPVIHKETTL